MIKRLALGEVDIATLEKRVDFHNAKLETLKDRMKHIEEQLNDLGQMITCDHPIHRRKFRTFETAALDFTSNNADEIKSWVECEDCGKILKKFPVKKSIQVERAERQFIVDMIVDLQKRLSQMEGPSSDE